MNFQIPWGKLIKYYNTDDKLTQNRKKIVFCVTFFLSAYYLYFILTSSFFSKQDLYNYIFSFALEFLGLVLVLFRKNIKASVVVLCANDFINTTVAVWYSGGPFSLEILWYFTTIFGVMLLLDKHIGIVVSILTLINLLLLYYIQIQKYYDFRPDSLLANDMSNLLTTAAVFVIIILLAFFFTEKEVITHNSLEEKDLNINNLEEELKQTINEIVKIRSNIARDFHDVMGNKLASIASISQNLALNPDQEFENVKTGLTKINNLSKEVYSGTKDFIWVLNMPQNNAFEIYMFLQDFGEKLFDNSGTDFESSLIDLSMQSYEISFSKCSHIILIVKEIMTNAFVHSKGTKVSLNLLKDKDSVSLEISDNGIGFDMHNINRMNGLNNIRQRAAEASLGLTCASRINMGTTYILTF